MNLSTASDAIRQAGQRWRWRSRWRWRLDRRVAFAIFACFFALGIGITTYLIAKFDGVGTPQSVAIERQAFQTSFDQARSDAAAHAREDGAREGAAWPASLPASTPALESASAGARRPPSACRRGSPGSRRSRQQRLPPLLLPRDGRHTGGTSHSARHRAPATGTGPRPRPCAAHPPAPEPPCFDAAGHPC